MKARFFWIALGLVGISWIANSIYAYSKQLDEPIFLDHYINVELRDHLSVTLYYLTNKNDSSVVSSVAARDVSGYPEEQYFSDGQIQNRQTFNNHVLRSVTVNFNSYQLEQKTDTKGYSFTEMDVFFTDGKKVIAPIGIVTIRPTSTERTPLEQVRSGASNYYQNSRYRATEPLTIETIKDSFQEVLRESSLIKIDSPNTLSVSEPIDVEVFSPLEKEWATLPGLDSRNVQFPFVIKKGEKLNMYNSINPNFHAVLESTILISGTTEAGKTFSTTVGFIHQPYLEQKDVNDIIKEKTEGDTNG